MISVPALVERVTAAAEATSFPASCAPDVGRFLAVLAGGVPPGGAILEIGTGAGVGTAWLASGLDGRNDATLDTIEVDAERSEQTAALGWPEWTHFHHDDALDVLSGLGQFDLVFADAEGGKWHGRERTLDAVRPGGLLVVDDMTPPDWGSEHHRAMTGEVREALTGDERLVSAELHFASGVISTAGTSAYETAEQGPGRAVARPQARDGSGRGQRDCRGATRDSHAPADAFASWGRARS